MKWAYSALFLAKKAFLLDLSAGRYPRSSFHTVPRSRGGTPDHASSRSARRSTAAAAAVAGLSKASKRAIRGSEAERVGGGGEADESLTSGGG